MTGALRDKLWVVRSGDGSTLADVLRRAGEGPSAIDEGRVFVGRKRATRAEQPVRAGDAIRIGPKSASTPEIEILLQERGLVACVKPAGLPTVPDHAGASHALVARVAKAVGARASDVRVTSRLDREVSGVVVFALDAAAEQRLREARAAGTYARRYVALAAGPLGAGGVWDAPIGRAALHASEAGARRHLRAAFGPDEKPATTRWRKVASAGDHAENAVALVAVDPVTGRTHQIRVHASHAGAPLLGDRDYGGPSRVTLATGRILTLSRIALHAARVSVDGIHVTAPIPEELTRLWASIGGAPEAWRAALTCDTARTST